MATLSHRRVPNVVLSLTIFWGGVLASFLWIRGFNFYYVIPWLMAILVGVWVAHVHAREYRKRILLRLIYQENLFLPVSDRRAFSNTSNGFTSSIGATPFASHGLPRAESYSFLDLQAHCPQELASDGTFAKLLGKYLSESSRDAYPHHLALFDALAMTLLHHENITTPAGIDRHGGRSLLMHTLLVFALMAHRAPSHLYVCKYGLVPIDNDFKLNPLDPLIPLIAMAHDIGKIRKIQYDANQVATKLLPGHEMQSARDVARMPELWCLGIPNEDRRILQTILHHSGRVIHIPIQINIKENTFLVTSDRLHALVDLLGECDRIASSIEMGGSYKFDEAAANVNYKVNDESQMEPENFFGSLARFLLAMPVNARSPQKSVGFKRCDQDFTRNRHVLIIDENEFSKNFAVFLDAPQMAERDAKSSPVTKMVLESLDENKFLFRVDEGEGSPLRAATSCLYKIEFRDPAGDPEAKAPLTLSSSFLIDITDWDSMRKLVDIANCHSKPQFAGFKLGRQPGNVRRSADDSIAADKFGGNSQAIGQDVTVLMAKKPSMKKKNQQNNPKKLVEKIGYGLFHRQIGVAATDDKAIAIVGHDAFFTELGIDLVGFALTLDKTAYNELGIIDVSKSVKNPSVHVVKLDKSVYVKFTHNLALLS